jgi:hypothetical protein
VAAAADTRPVAFQSPSPELHAPLKTNLKKLSKNMKKNIYIRAYSFMMINKPILNPLSFLSQSSCYITSIP